MRSRRCYLIIVLPCWEKLKSKIIGENFSELFNFKKKEGKKKKKQQTQEFKKQRFLSVSIKRYFVQTQIKMTSHLWKLQSTTPFV